MKINWRKLDWYYPIIGGTLALAIHSFVFWLLQKSVLDLQKIDGILGAVINLAAIIVGFLATMVSILVATTGAPVLNRLRKQERLDELYAYLRAAIISGFIVVALSAILFALLPPPTCWVPYIAGLWIGSSVHFLLAAFRMVNVMLQILREITIDATETQETPPEITFNPEAVRFTDTFDQEK